MKKLNLIFVNDYACVKGGAERVAIDEAVALSRKEYNVFFFSAVGPVDPALTQSDVKVICLNQEDLLTNPNPFKAMVQGIWNHHARRVFTELLSDFSMDNTLIHMHNWTKALSSSVFQVAKKKGFRVIYTMHDLFLFCPNGGLYNHPANKICRVKPAGVQCLLTNCDSRNYMHKLYRWGRQAVQRMAGIPSKLDGIISISPITAAFIRQYLNANMKVYNLPNYINTEQGSYQDRPASGRAIYVGRISREKGVDVFCQACRQADMKGMVVGDGPLLSQYKTAYPEISFVGYQDHHAVRSMLMDSDCLVFPSKWRETFGLVVYEALSQGVPCLVSSHTAPAQAIKDQVNGYLFDGLDDLVGKMEKIKSESNRQPMARKAYQLYWEKPLLMADHIDRLDVIYHDLKKSEVNK